MNNPANPEGHDRETPSEVTEDPADSLPPGAHPERESTPGNVREAQPYDDAPADGKFAPDADNPPPSSD